MSAKHILLLPVNKIVLLHRINIHIHVVETHGNEANKAIRCGFIMKESSK